MQDVIDFNLLKEYDTTLKDVLQVWTKQKTYSLGDKVKYKGRLLECTTAGTSGTTTLNFTGLDIGDTITDGTVVWELVEEESGKGIDFYTVGESYNVNDIVIYNGNIYQCITAHTATSTFDATKWTEISASGGVDLPEWQSNTSYTAGKYLVHEGTVYKVDNDFTSGTIFSDTNLTSYIAPIMQGATSSASGQSGIVPKPNSTDVDKFLKGDGTWGSAGGGISIWQANTAYNVNDVVVDSNLIWQCATAHTSTTTFDESKWICISGGEISNGMEIVDLWEGMYSTSNESSSSLTNTITLSDNITNYEYIIIYMCLYDSSGGRKLKLNSQLIKVEDITYDFKHSFINSVYTTSSEYGSLEYRFSDATHFGISWKYMGGSDVPTITRIQGIRKAKPIVSSGMKYEVLWYGTEGSTSSEGTSTINLSDNVNKYKSLRLILTCYRSGAVRPYTRDIDVEEYIDFITNGASSYEIGVAHDWYSSSDQYFTLLYDSTNTQLHIGYKYNVLTKVIGISEGVQIPTGVQAARVTLFEGEYNTVNNSTTVLPNTLQISDSIENYDYLEFTINGFKSANENNYMTSIVDIKDITYNEASFRITASYYDHYSSFLCAFTDSTHFAICYNDKNIWTDGKITKITGIKYIQPDSYSTEEKLIGTWIDGKPLYRKVFADVVDNTNSGITSSTTTVVKLYGCIVGGDGTFTMLPNADTELYIVRSSGVIRTTTSRILNYVVVEYTKN